MKSRIQTLKEDWNNINLLGRINILLGVILIIINFVFPGKIPVSALFYLTAAVVIWIGSQDKIEPHLEYQKKLTDFEGK